MANPKVSILCIAFDQAGFIRQTLDSFLMQKTNFEFEILINDDASKDGTAEIIEEYSKKYPGVVKPVFQKNNQYSKGKRNLALTYLMPRARGKYIALCEGDDYWTDPNKLQKQVDFLESNPDFALCFHPVRVVYEDGSVEDSIFPPDNDSSKFTVEELLKRNFIQTNSVMYRRAKYEDMNLKVTPGDWYLHLYHARFGKIGFIDETMSVYRKNKNGIWWDKERVWKEHGEAHLRLYEELIKLFGSNNDHKEAIMNNVVIAIEKMLQYSALTEDIIAKYPSFIGYALNNLYTLSQDSKNLNEAISRLEKEKKQLQRNHSKIVQSKSYRAGSLLLAVPRKAKNLLRKLQK